MPTNDDLKALQEMSLYEKVILTKARIREFINKFGADQCYVSFSGGKDSTVLLDIARQVDPNILAVFSDTGLEYPELKEHVKSHDNVLIVRPDMTFKEVLNRYGYPVLTKEIARAINTARNTPSGKVAWNKFIKPVSTLYDYSKYKALIFADLDFKISDSCCDVMKKRPMHKIKKFPIVGTMTTESISRKREWLKAGCNVYTGKIQCRPISFWTEKDIFEYTVQNNLKQCEVYGEFTCEGCSGCKRTGCIYCAFGAHLRNDNRYLLLKETHPQLYKYCMQDLGFEHVLHTIEKTLGKEMYNL